MQKEGRRTSVVKRAKRGSCSFFSLKEKKLTLTKKTMNENEEKTKLLDWYINNLKWSIIPVGENKIPLVNWKSRQEQPFTVEELEEAWRKLEQPKGTNGTRTIVGGVAVVTGKISGVSVVDIDFKNGGEDFLKDYDTPTAETGGGGRHYFFRYNPEVKTATGVRKGVDIRSDGGIIILPPSMHPSGKRYIWLKEPGKVPFAEFPSFLLEELKSKPQLSASTVFEGTVVEEGTRNNTLAVFIGKELSKHKQSEWGLVNMLAHAYNERYCNPPLDTGEVNTIFESISRAELAERVSGEKVFVEPTIETPVIVEPLTSDRERVAGFLKEVEYRRECNRQGRLVGLTTGFKHLDEVTLGLQTGLWVIGAGTSLGKTTFVKQLVDMVVSNNDVPALFISYEQSHFELFLKSISRLSQIDSRRIQKGRFTTAEEERLLTAIEKFSNFSGKIYTKEAGEEDGLEVIKARAIEIMKKHNTTRVLICIDYLQLIPPNQRTDTNRSKYFSSTKEKLDGVCSHLRALARDLNSPIIVISSFNRSSYGKNGTVDITSFKESGGVEYSADVAMVMEEDKEKTSYTDSECKHPCDNVKVVKVGIIKNRNGELATMDFRFDMKRATFEADTEQQDTGTPLETFNNDIR